jgi:hypothetical protein
MGNVSYQSTLLPMGFYREIPVDECIRLRISYEYRQPLVRHFRVTGKTPYAAQGAAGVSMLIKCATSASAGLVDR